VNVTIVDQYDKNKESDITIDSDSFWKKHPCTILSAYRLVIFVSYCNQSVQKNEINRTRCIILK